MKDFEYNVQDTIAAISTPIGKGAISVIRLSGPLSFSIITTIFRPALKKTRFLAKPGTYYGSIFFHNKILDQVIIFLRKNPKSFTGEDMVEINCHGNIIITESILNVLVIKGARLAGPGEFTLRAFINKKMDLIQAEAINELVNAKSYDTVQMALQNMAGTLSSELTDLVHMIKNILLPLEASMDHPDEDIHVYDSRDMMNQMNLVKKKINKMIGSFDIHHIHNKGISMLIVGSVNVGKSSLFNLLIKRDKSIISHIPGTTRDLVEEYIEIDGRPVMLIDTAGIKKIKNSIDKNAIKRTYDSLKNSNIVLSLFDNSRPLSKTDIDFMKLIKESGKTIIIIINKCDLIRKINVNPIKNYFPDNPLIRVSVSRETNVKTLEKAIKKCLKKYDFTRSAYIQNLRQKDILIKINIYLDDIIKNLKSKTYPDIIAIDIQNVLNLFGRMLGKYSTDDMIKDIFSNFCIGK